MFLAFAAAVLMPQGMGVLPAATIKEDSTGIQIQVTGHGYYSVYSADPAWRFVGGVGARVTDMETAQGVDGIGPYREIVFDFNRGGAREGTIRIYVGKPVVLFKLTYLEAGANDFSFPALVSYPQLAYHMSYSGVFGGHTYQSLASDSPWLFFDSSANAFILSPASHFGVAAMQGGSSQPIHSGIDTAVTNLPQGFAHQTMLVLGKGINTVFETWGRAMSDLQGKTRPPNDADTSLARVGYWTDAGAVYYYGYVSGLGYAGTLLAARDDFERAGIPLGYVQLDSWFYPKGPNAQWHDNSGGIYEYRACPDLFPGGLKAFQAQLGVPLITHARWIDVNSPYRAQYRISGNVAIDPAYWDAVAGYLQDAGVATYEQDWLADRAQPELNLDDYDAFMDQMARSTSAKGLTLQYCMALPRDYLQSSKYSNVTTIRTSADRLDESRWDPFLYGSRLAGALGAWPWADVFMSCEVGNVLLATLSAGPVGLGDAIGTLNAQNLLQAARPDGIIVKPDVPIVPVDDSYVNDAQGLDAPMVASTYTDFGGTRAYYVFAYARGTNTNLALSPNSLGLAGDVYVYSYFTGAGQVVARGGTFGDTIQGGFAYYVLVPITDSGLAFLGDAGHFVSLGKKRITQLTEDQGLEATIAFAKNEKSRVVHGYSLTAPAVTATIGSAGAVSYDSSNHLFSVTISPGPDGTAVIHMQR